MKRALGNTLLAILAGAVVFGLVRLSGWMGSLTTVRTPFYFTLVNLGSWVAACIGVLYAFFQLSAGGDGRVR